jgi:hypothetical protein
MYVYAMNMVSDGRPIRDVATELEKIRHIKVEVEAETDEDSHLTPEVLFDSAVEAINNTLRDLNTEIDDSEMCGIDENVYASGIGFRHTAASACLGRVGDSHAHADGRHGKVSGRLYAIVELKLYSRKDLGYVE